MPTEPAAASPLSDQTVLVTGGGGFLGGAIVRLLVARGDSVRSFSRSRYPRLDTMGVDQVQGDLADTQALQTACQGVDLVFHVAAKAGVWGPYDAFYQTNVVGTENIIRACRDNGVGRLIYTSSPSVVFDGRDMEGGDESLPYPDIYHTHYPRTKAMAERRVRQAADGRLRTIALRPHLIWGPGDNHLVPRIIQRARRLRQVGDGQNKVDTIYVDNAAHAHLLAAEKLALRPELVRSRLFHQPGRADPAVGYGERHPGGGRPAARHAHPIGSIGPPCRGGPGMALPDLPAAGRAANDPVFGRRTGHLALVRHQCRQGRPWLSTDGIHRRRA